MQLRSAFVIILLLVQAAFAQTPEAELKSKIAHVRYAPLAEQAWIQGDVHLKINSGVVTVVSGHPLLANTAVQSVKSFGPIQGKSDVDMTYHFVLVDTTKVPTPVTVERGNAFQRAILHLFGFKTEKVVVEYQCQVGVPPANDLKVSGATLEIWIYGTTRCLQTQASTLLAQR
jgi:hypothetical protein